MQPANRPPLHRDAWVEIDLDAIAANARALAGLVPPSTEVMAVVKADAYGHGAVAVAKRLSEAGIASFGVATLDEGLALREAGIRHRIVVLYSAPRTGIRDGLAAGLELTAGSAEDIEAIIAEVPEPAAPFIHLKLDTGMTRQGIRFDEIERNAALLRSAAPIVTAVWTHLRDGADAGSAREQRTAFAEGVARLATLGVRGRRHVSASAAILAGDATDEEMIRPGLSLYGAVPAELEATGHPSPIELRPAMSVRARPVRVVDVPAGTQVGYGGTYVTSAPARLATLPLGYADGVPRVLGNGRGQLLARGKRVPIVGRISMDSLVVDVTGVPQVGRRTTFTLLGEEDGLSIGANELSRAAGTIAQETFVRFNGRLPRLQHSDGP
ncbi:MAG TPA: alanine racemase [Candidatus Limnocylindria bacterium]|nr:alanine racemase [Candidatus Limnocylindria bacterium]